MLFHTPEFLLFFTLFLLCYLPVKGGRGGVWVVVVASQIFYAAWDFKFLPLLWGTMLIDFFVARGMGATTERSRRRLLLALSVGSNVAVLCFFKYWNLLAAAIGEWAWGDAAKLTITGLVLPIGVSFYTFQCLSYVCDVYRNEHPPVRSLRDYAAFVTYFPQLVMGPIERMRHLLPQLLRPAPFSVHRTASGLVLFAVGFFRKGAGDALGSLADPVFADLNGASPALAVVGLLSFWLQVYLDFAGYTDMARGISRIIGVELSWNFRTPYFATSMQDFWRRWHITLSTWLRDYIFIPLGGSRFRRWMTVRNLYLTMLLSACWHGGGWNFLIFGLLHGTFLTISSLFSKTSLSALLNASSRPIRRAFWNTCGWAATMLAFIYSLVYFRADSFHESCVLHERLLDWISSPSALPFSASLAFLLVPLLFLEFWQRSMLDTEAEAVERPLGFLALSLRGACVGVLIVYGLVLFAGTPTSPFIYFQF